MEHLIIRNASLNSTEVIRLDPTGCFTQVRVGANPFALDAMGAPRDVRPGDLLWVAQSGYGVVGTARITHLSPPVSVSSLDDIEALRREHRGFAPTYWDDLRDRLPGARAKGGVLKLVFVHYEQGVTFTPGEQFRLVRKRGAQNSWIVFRDDQAKAAAFAKRGISVSATLLEEEAGDYGAIPDKIRWAVIQVWKTHCVGQRQHPDEPCEFDHFVPKALGGPGILLENVIPLPRHLNRAKSHRVPASLAAIARQWNLLTDEEHRTWGDPTAEGSVRRGQEQLTRRVTAAIRGRPVPDQRRFYFEVLETGIGPHVRTYFEEAGVRHPAAGGRTTAP